MTKHPNAIVGGASGAGGGALVVYLLGLLHAHIDLYAAGLIFTAASSLALFIGRNGIRGVWNLVKNGTGQAAAPPAP